MIRIFRVMNVHAYRPIVDCNIPKHSGNRMQMLSRKLNLKPSTTQLQLQSPASDTDNFSMRRPRSRTLSNPWMQYSEFFKNKSFLIPDTVAFATILPYFKALSGFSSKFKITLVELIGYEAYFVEQWISSRESNSLIVTYTGDENDRILAYHVQSLLTDVKVDNMEHSPLDTWPTEFVAYLIEQLESPFCVATDTTMGYAFITNLAQLNPFLSLIEAKTGNITIDYELFVVNNNLRKLGCGSRSATTTDEPSKSMDLKFKSAFKIDHRVNINYAVISLIHIAQVCLHYFGLLDPIYCDGLFCEKTEASLNEWWTVVSKAPLYTQIIKIRPPQCSPCDSIQAIIGFTLLCRYLLELGGNNFGVPKDIMEAKKMPVAIGRFQKYLKFSETSIFDVETLTRLFDWAQNIKTSQNITKDLSKMKNLVKNTVLDITSGKNFQIIAQNANISPFHIYSNYEVSKFINCQNLDNFKHIPLGKQLSYLLYHNGKPIDLHKSTLSMETIKQSAATTSNSNIFNGVRRLKSQLNMTLTDAKPEQVTIKINGQDEQAIISDDDTDLEKHDMLYDDDVVSIANSYKEEADINKKLKKRFKIKLASPMLSSDEDNIDNHDFSDDQDDDIGITSYKPNRKSRNHMKKSSRASSLGANSIEASYPNDRYFTEGSKLSVAPRKHRGSSLSSHFRFSRKNHADNIEDEELISDSEFYRSDKSSRRNTELNIAFKNAANNIKCVNALPHVINPVDLNESSVRIDTLDQVNDKDSDYDYEQGFEYDYEVDGDHFKLRENLKSAKNKDSDHKLKLSVYPENGSDIPSASDISVLNSGLTNNMDQEYADFKRRLKRRHSIPLVPCELNKYSIQMLAKEKLENSKNLNIEPISWNRMNKTSTWDCSLSNPVEPDLYETESFDLRRNKSIYAGAPSLHLNDSQFFSFRPAILYSNPLTKKPIKRCRSFSTLESSLTFEGENSDVYGFEVSNRRFLTSEVLAMCYLKLQAKYQFDMIRKSTSIVQNLQKTTQRIKECSEFDQTTMSPVSITYTAARGDEHKAIGKYYELEDKIKNTSKDNARLKYELRLLLQKTKEVENNLKTLQDFKIRGLNSKIDTMMCGTKINAYYAAKFHKMIGEEPKDKICDPIENCKEASGEYIYLTDGCINWKTLSWQKIYENPRIIVYIFFHMLLCTVLKRVDPRKLEQRWKQIDKNETVTMVIKSLYAPYTAATKSDIETK